MVGLCDCNNFFVSCERVFNPSLEGRPVIVLSSNDGCVIARSNESKALGIKMGQPLFQIRELVDKNRVVLHSSNYQLYGDMSHRVMETLKANLPSIEIYSIDEAFLDVSGIATEQLKAYGERLSRLVKRNTGIPVSIGLAPTKTLAKVASKLCKGYPKLNGACLFYREEDITKVLSKYPVGDVWGIGRKSTKMLAQYGITTAQQFREAPEEWIRSKMGLTGVRTWLELNSQPAISFEDRPSDKQSIMVSRSFAKEIYEFEELHSSISQFLTSAAEKLRRQGSVAGEMQVFIHTNRHREDMPQQYEGELVKFSTPTDSTLEMAKSASSALRSIYRKGYGYKKAGVILSDISQSSGVQSSLFDTLDREKHSSLMRTLDTINLHYGKSSLTLGSNTNRTPTTNSEHLSPRYTTSWDDILTIKV